MNDHLTPVLTLSVTAPSELDQDIQTMTFLTEVLKHQRLKIAELERVKVYMSAYIDGMIDDITNSYSYPQCNELS